MEDTHQAMTTPLSLFSDSWNGSTSVDTGVNATFQPWVETMIWKAGNYLWYVCPPIILLFGVFGNIMTIIIMRRMSSSESTISIYFTATAVMDLLYLITDLLSRWFRYTFAFNILTLHTGVCKIVTWIYTGGGTIGCWCLVCMTVHRAMSVIWPHRVKLICTRRTVFTLVMSIILFHAALYSHYLIGFESFYNEKKKDYSCSTRFEYESYIHFTEYYFAYIELSVYCLIPFCVLVVSNSILVWKVAVSVKTAGRYLSKGDAEQVHAREKAANSVTVTVIVVSSAFIVLTLPASVNYIVFHFAISHLRLSGHDYDTAHFINALCSLLGHTNSAVNFYLYCLTGRKFREEFLKIMTGCKNRDRSGAS